MRGDFRDNDSMGEVVRHQWSFPLLLMTAPVMRVVSRHIPPSFSLALDESPNVADNVPDFLIF